MTPPYEYVFKSGTLNPNFAFCILHFVRQHDKSQFKWARFAPRPCFYIWVSHIPQKESMGSQPVKASGPVTSASTRASMVSSLLS